MLAAAMVGCKVPSHPVSDVVHAVRANTADNNARRRQFVADHQCSVVVHTGTRDAVLDYSTLEPRVDKYDYPRTMYRCTGVQTTSVQNTITVFDNDDEAAY